MALKTKWLLTKNQSVSCVMPGVYRALAFCDGCAVVFHSPKGCAQIASTMDAGSQFRMVGEGRKEWLDGVPLLSSHLREKDCIFGGTDRLRDVLRYTAETYHPECIAVAVSCMAGVIGDDVEAVCEDAEAELGIPILLSPAAGFLGGGYEDGYRAMIDQIIRRFFRPQAHVPGRVLLLGDQMGPWGQYAMEVKDMLGWFGLDAKWQFPGYVPFREWPEIPSASLGIILGSAGQTNGVLEDTAAKLEKDFGISFLPPVYPIGWENTGRFIHALAAHLGREADGEALLRKKEEELGAFVRTVLPVTEGKTAVIGIGRGPQHYDPADTLHSVERLHMNVSAVVLYDNLAGGDRQKMTELVRKSCAAPVLSADDGREAIRSADILLTTDELLDPGTKQLFIPMVALIGASGEIAMLRGIYRLLCRYGNKGGIAYV